MLNFQRLNQANSQQLTANAPYHPAAESGRETRYKATVTGYELRFSLSRTYRRAANARTVRKLKKFNPIACN